MAYNTLNKLKWTGKLGGCDVVILHRGAPQDRKIIKGSDITEVKRHNFYYREVDGEEVYIPNHRVLEILCSGKVVWKRLPKRILKAGP